MLTFVVRYGIKPVAETFNFNPVNKAIAYLEVEKVRYRIVSNYKNTDAHGIKN